MNIDDLGIYDDLDEFQQEHDKKSNELLAWEAKYNESLEEIEKLKTENKQLKKKLKTIEVNFQCLLDTAKAEVNRKDRQIDELRREKDNICFRRKLPSHNPFSQRRYEEQFATDVEPSSAHAQNSTDNQSVEQSEHRVRRASSDFQVAKDLPHHSRRLDDKSANKASTSGYSRNERNDHHKSGSSRHRYDESRIGNDNSKSYARKEGYGRCTDSDHKSTRSSVVTSRDATNKKSGKYLEEKHVRNDHKSSRETKSSNTKSTKEENDKSCKGINSDGNLKTLHKGTSKKNSRCLGEASGSRYRESSKERNVNKTCQPAEGYEKLGTAKERDSNIVSIPLNPVNVRSTHKMAERTDEGLVKSSCDSGPKMTKIRGVESVNSKDDPRTALRVNDFQDGFGQSNASIKDSVTNLLLNNSKILSDVVQTLSSTNNSAIVATYSTNALESTLIKRQDKMQEEKCNDDEVLEFDKSAEADSGIKISKKLPDINPQNIPIDLLYNDDVLIYDDTDLDLTEDEEFEEGENTGINVDHLYDDLDMIGSDAKIANETMKQETSHCPDGIHTSCSVAKPPDTPSRMCTGELTQPLNYDEKTEKTHVLPNEKELNSLDNDNNDKTGTSNNNSVQRVDSCLTPLEDQQESKTKSKDYTTMNGSDKSELHQSATHHSAMSKEAVESEPAENVIDANEAKSAYVDTNATKIETNANVEGIKMKNLQLENLASHCNNVGTSQSLELPILVQNDMPTKQTVQESASKEEYVMKSTNIGGAEATHTVANKCEMSSTIEKVQSSMCSVSKQMSISIPSKKSKSIRDASKGFTDHLRCIRTICKLENHNSDQKNSAAAKKKFINSYKIPKKKAPDLSNISIPEVASNSEDRECLANSLDTDKDEVLSSRFSSDEETPSNIVNELREEIIISNCSDAESTSHLKRMLEGNDDDSSPEQKKAKIYNSPAKSSTPNLPHDKTDKVCVALNASQDDLESINTTDEGKKIVAGFENMQLTMNKMNVVPDLGTADDSCKCDNDVTNITVEETKLETSDSFNAILNSSSETKKMSLGSSDYLFEQVSENVVQLFITRKRVKKRPKSIGKT